MSCEEHVKETNGGTLNGSQIGAAALAVIGLVAVISVLFIF